MAGRKAVTARGLLDNVPPCYSANDKTDCSRRYAILAGQGNQSDAARRIAPANVLHVLFGEFDVAISFALADFWVYVRTVAFAASRSFRVCVASMLFAACGPTLLNHIGHVVVIRTQKKMARILAAWGIALVKNTQASRNGTIRDDPSNAVGTKRTTRTVQIRTKPKVTIALGEPADHPRPALIRPALIDLRAEALFVFRGQRGNGTMLNSHDILLNRMSWSERLAGQSRRSLAFGLS